MIASTFTKSQLRDHDSYWAWRLTGNCCQIIDGGKDGFLRNIRDGCEGFATALLRLKQSSDWQTMSHAARTKIVVGFQETMMVRCYQTLINNLLGQ